ncbi:MAG: hypothetical protein Q9160_005506 [Pyrenula sp. 1 TL-2023]
MGVPALFRWLSKKYPKIVLAAIEEEPYEIDGVEYPVDTTKPNPNGDEFDNLYLDFNGIVHNCTHPEDRPAPANEAEMMLEIFKYTDRVVNVVRPRRVLMIAIDGVAPRAKMNQQRARRFRSARDAQEADEKKAEFDRLLRGTQRGADNGNSEDPLEEEVVKKTWDTNLITPGTPFMDILALSVRYWVAYKLNTDPAWKDLKVMISDATVPGEGEHKIMQFIRSQRTDPEYDPNTRHVFYGLDADLIMLGIATHEPYFRVLREDVFSQESKAQTCKLCGQKGHAAEACRGNAKEKSGQFDEKLKLPDKKPFIWLSVSVLREYLRAELDIPGQPFRFDLERALDDWVFMCFFVGNDFLPHLPSLNIQEDGIDTLIAIWRDNIPIMGGYLTLDGSVDLSRAQIILQGLAKQEDAIFKRRKESDDRRERNQKRRKQEEEARNESAKKRRRSSPDYSQGGSTRQARGNPEHREPAAGSVRKLDMDSLPVTYNMIVNRGAVDRANAANKSAAAMLKSTMTKKEPDGTDGQNAAEQTTNSENPNPETPPSALGKRKAETLEDQDNSTPGRTTPVKNETTRTGLQDLENQPDTVRLWEDGYADRYYESKFHVSPDDIEFRHKVARDYVEGFCWVLLYYFQGCPSWTWFYPHHYAPFAADFVDIVGMDVKFDHGTPFKPYEQLMGVMPAASRAALPSAFHPLMTEPDSEIIEFYPEEFDLDLNGAKQSWKAVVLLPWIDETRLLNAMAKIYPSLSAEEHARNELGSDALLISASNPLYTDISKKFYSNRHDPSTRDLRLDVRVGKLAGQVTKNDTHLPDAPLIPPLDEISLPEIDVDHSLNMDYQMPKSLNVHKSMLLRGVRPPPAVLDTQDISIIKSRSRNSGRSFGGAPLNGRNGSQRGRGRNGNISYAARDGPPPPQSHGDRDNRPNPFAAFIDPKFPPPPPPGMGGVPPPPQFAGRGGPPGGFNGYVPPRGGHSGGYQPPSHNGGGYNDRGGSYGGRDHSGRSGYDGGRGGYDGRNGYDRGGGHGGYDNRNGYSRGGYDDRRSHSDNYHAPPPPSSGRDSYRGSYDPRYGDGYGRR